jgi:hypothetical protein
MQSHHVLQFIVIGRNRQEVHDKAEKVIEDYLMAEGTLTDYDVNVHIDVSPCYSNGTATGSPLGHWKGEVTAREGHHEH